MKNFKFVAFIMLLALLFVSCDTNYDTSDEEALGTLTISTRDNVKGIAVTGGNILSADKFEYFAIPQFTNVSAPIVGQVGSVSGTGYTYEELNFVAGATTKIGPFTQGLWAFGIRALDTNGNVIAKSDTVQKYINASENNELTFDLNVISEGKGDISFSIASNKISEADGTLKVEYARIQNGIIGSYSTMPQGDITVASTSATNTFTGKLTNLDSGLYIMKIGFYSAGTLVGGETVSFMVNQGNEVTLNGKIENGFYAVGGIKINNIVGIAGTLGCSQITSGKCAKGTPMTFKWTNSGATVTSYHWNVNGTEAASTSNWTVSISGDTMTFTALQEGFYNISCVVLGENEQLGEAVLEFSTL